jgi:hypothetical protein
LSGIRVLSQENILEFLQRLKDETLQHQLLQGEEALIERTNQ